ncbi:MAG: hypothetical protein PHT92_03505 [Bacteroidales bacterium]|nr:hypothetical protein [Bacteroidales bacterium]
MIIGGEHYFTLGQLFRKSKGYIDHLVEEFGSFYNISFTFGGYFSLIAIIRALKPKFETDSIVLLPSYMCPSILIPFKLEGIKYRFYKVDEELFIDIDYLKSIIDERVKAVLFIDYFGASQLDRIQSIIAFLSARNITIIQDVVQCIELNNNFLFGDFIFNSFRKFSPFDGSIILSKEKMKIHFYDETNKYLKFKRWGQVLRYLHIELNLFPSSCFLKIFGQANKHYHVNGILKFSKFNLKQLNKFDVDQMVSNQKHYFNLLFYNFGNNMPKLLQSKNYVPLGFVIKLDNRDFVRKEFFKKNIFPPIHWILSTEFENTICEKSLMLSNEILTIPITGLTKDKFNYLTENMFKILDHESIFKST